MKWFAYVVRIAVALALWDGAATPLVAAPQDQSTPAALTPVAVLVFSNLTGAAVDDWIGVGIAETVVTGLDSVGGLRLMRPGPSETAVRTAGDMGSPVAVAQALGARWVISGAYQRLEDQLRLTARVTEVATANVLQSVTVDGFMGDLFALQDQLVAEVRSALESRPRGRRRIAPAGNNETARAPAVIDDFTDERVASTRGARYRRGAAGRPRDRWAATTGTAGNHQSGCQWGRDRPGGAVNRTTPNRRRAR